MINLVNKGDVIRILVVDDHPIVLKGTQALLAETDDVEVVGLANNGKMPWYLEYPA